MAPSSPVASSQALEHSPSHSPPPDAHHTPESPEPHISNMSSAQEELAPIADAFALQVIKHTQTGLSFLSLPPEVRNMIYHYIFTPVRDETCRVRVIYYDYLNAHLKGIRRDCYSARWRHVTCRAQYHSLENLCPVFDIPGNHTHSALLRTCHTIMEEATPISLAHMHISITSSSFDCAHMDSNALRILLAGMGQPQGGYISVVTYTHVECEYLEDDQEFLSRIINSTGVRIGHLVLHANLGKASIKHFVANLDSLEHKPASVEWVHRCPDHPEAFQGQRVEFNAAAVQWLAELAMVKATSSNTHLPLLRDFLPQYFKQSSD